MCTQDKQRYVRGALLQEIFPSNELFVRIELAFFFGTIVCPQHPREARDLLSCHGFLRFDDIPLNLNKRGLFPPSPFFLSHSTSVGPKLRNSVTGRKEYFCSSSQEGLAAVPVAT